MGAAPFVMSGVLIPSPGPERFPAAPIRRPGGPGCSTISEHRAGFGE